MPLVTVVIPTHGRPRYLPRAVDSAIKSQGDSIEVIVVPNGPDGAWMGALGPWSGDPRLHVSPIPTAHADAARNHGIHLATGKYIRFLDDDDYLLPAAKEQVSAMERRNCDISVGRVDVASQDGKIISKRVPPQTHDLVDSVLSRDQLSLIHAYLYRRSALQGATWDPDCTLGQDKLWLYELCQRHDWTMHRTDDCVGVWVQHRGARITSAADKRLHAHERSLMLMNTITALAAAGRLSEHRKDLAADHLWRLICGSYYLDPSYWRRVLDQTLALAPTSRPSVFLYRSRATSWVPPKLLLGATAPLQHGRRWARIASSRLGLYRPVIRP